VTRRPAQYAWIASCAFLKLGLAPIVDAEDGSTPVFDLGSVAASSSDAVVFDALVAIAFEIVVDFVSLCYEAKQRIPVFEAWRSITPAQLLCMAVSMLHALCWTVTFMAAVPNMLLPEW